MTRTDTVHASDCHPHSRPEAPPAAGPLPPTSDVAVRILGPMIVAVWLIWLALAPSLWLACAGLAWVVYVRTNRIKGALMEATLATAALHRPLPKE